MQYLTKRGYSNVKIGALMGFNESTVRRALKSTQKTETV
jgi:DNA-binding CsgD family transcriptional regulator